MPAGPNRGPIMISPKTAGCPARARAPAAFAAKTMREGDGYEEL